jgi:predicted RNase H-like HicB family nuclease
MTRQNEFELAVAYEQAEAGWLTATIPALPGVITAGRTKDEARDNVLDALRTMLAPPVEEIEGHEVEVLRVSLERGRQRHRSR